MIDWAEAMSYNACMTLTATDFAPITLNGESIPTFRMIHMLQIGDHFYEQEFAASEDCWCRRCSLHDDFGGCIPAEAMWQLVSLMTGTDAS